MNPKKPRNFTYPSRWRQWKHPQTLILGVDTPNRGFFINVKKSIMTSSINATGGAQPALGLNEPAIVSFNYELVEKFTKALNELIPHEKRGLQKNFNIYQNQEKITFNSHFCDVDNEYQLKFMIIGRAKPQGDLEN